MILFKVWPAFRLLAEDMVWCPEWQLMTYWGFTPDVSSAYDSAEIGLCHGEYPDQKWERSGINNFDSVYKAEFWHTYGFEWAEDRARSGSSFNDLECLSYSILIDRLDQGLKMMIVAIIPWEIRFYYKK